jgi:hypothetical protein
MGRKPFESPRAVALFTNRLACGDDTFNIVSTAPVRIAIRAWNHRMLPGQYALFFHDARTDVMLDEAGSVVQREDAVAVFESLDGAREYARETVERRPVLRAEIFDSRGGLVEKIYSETMRRRFDPRRLARRDVQIGGALLAGAAGTTTYAALGNWQSIWAYIIGTKLLIVGTFIISRGIGWYLDDRRGR